MEDNKTIPGTQDASEKTTAERYPLINDKVYRLCVEQVLDNVKLKVSRLGGADALKSSPIKQLAKAGNLNADFMLAHFAGIFDGNSPLPSGQRHAVKAILTDAAGLMTQRVMAIKQKADQEAAKQAETTSPEPTPEEGGKE